MRLVWTLACTLGGAAGAALAGQVSEAALPDMTAAAATAIVFAAAFVVPQAIVLVRSLGARRSAVWTAATFGAMVAASAVLALVGWAKSR